MLHTDDEKTDLGNQRHVYEDVLLECTPEVPEQPLEDTVAGFG